MKLEKLVPIVSKGFIILSGISILSVSLMAMQSPQAVMDLVSVKLPNNDAYSSIRGVYGGVGITLFAALVYTTRRNISEALALLSILWGLYAFSRILTIISEGPLGSFGNQWLGIESVFFLTAFVLYLLNKKRVRVFSTNISASLPMQV